MITSKPLSGLKVLDFSAVYAGPICARMLSDCGAEVTKVEPLQGGDITRGPHGNSRIFAHFNAGKRSIAVDLKAAEGQKIAKALIAQADVVIENFRPGIMKRFGLDYETLKQEFPRIVYCSISGFGQNGPFRDRAAYAPIAHASSGFDIAHLESQGESQTRPSVWGIMIADMLTGSYAFGAIQTALLGRASSDKGDFIDVSMMESMISLIPGQVQAAQVEKPPAAGGFHPISVSDGFVMICIVSEKNLQGLARAMERPALLQDERFGRTQRHKHMPEFISEIESWSSGLSAIKCEQALNDTGVPCSMYVAPAELFDHPQVVSRKVFTRLNDARGEFVIQNAPFHFSGSDTTTSTEVPELGQHTDEILSTKLGFDAAEVKNLRVQGVVG